MPADATPAPVPDDTPARRWARERGKRPYHDQENGLTTGLWMWVCDGDVLTKAPQHAFIPQPLYACLHHGLYFAAETECYAALDAALAEVRAAVGGCDRASVLEEAAGIAANVVRQYFDENQGIDVGDGFEGGLVERIKSALKETL